MFPCSLPLLLATELTRIGAGKRLSIQVNKNDLSNILRLLAKEIGPPSGSSASSTPTSSTMSFSHIDEQFHMEVDDVVSASPEARSLIELGFSGAIAFDALERFSNDKQAAVEWLISSQPLDNDEIIAKAITQLQVRLISSSFCVQN